MKLTDDLFYEDNGEMKIIPKGTPINEVKRIPDPSDYRRGDENDSRSPYYMEPPEVDDADIEDSLAEIMSGETKLDGKSLTLMVYYDPQNKVAYIDTEGISHWEDELVTSLEHAINWIKTDGQAIIAKHKIESPIYGISGPDKDGEYLVSLAEKSDIGSIEPISVDSFKKAYELYINAAKKYAKEKAKEDWEPSEPDYEQMLRDREENLGY